MAASRAHTTTAGKYPIRVVSRLTGIGIDTLRAWERRYNAVTPSRDRESRLYSDADVARLRLINQAASSGHRVGQIAGLSDKDLRALTAAHTVQAAPAPRAALDTSAFTSALAGLDNAAIDQEFSQLAAVLPPLEIVQDVLLPALREAGDQWNRRRGGIALEHVLSATTRHLLGSFLRLYAPRHPKVRLLFTTTAGDRHEIGILCAAMLAASSGLGVSYLGADLPADAIVDAANATKAQVVVLGLTLTTDGATKARELRAIVKRLPAGVELWTGGAAAGRHAPLLGTRGLVLPDFDAYLRQLVRIGGQPR
jgi:DNA-binding transcriptional MerR regulator